MAEPVSAVTLWGVAGLLGLLGFCIRVQRRLYLVADYDPDRVADGAALATLGGGLVLFVGVLTAVLGVVAAVGRATPTVWAVYTGAVLVTTAGASLARQVSCTCGPEPPNRDHTES